MPGFGGRNNLLRKSVVDKLTTSIALYIHPQPAMLTCYACMRRCLRTIIGDLPQIPSSPRSKLTSNAYGGISFTRNYSSSSTRETPDHGRRGGDNSGSNARQKWIESRGIRPASKKKTLFSTDKELSQQLRYLKDPLKLADYVRKTLQRDDFETAQKVVRAASSDIQCVVSWNHLVDWQLSKGSMNAAIKTYNEVFRLFLKMYIAD